MYVCLDRWVGFFRKSLLQELSVSYTCKLSATHVYTCIMYMYEFYYNCVCMYIYIYMYMYV